MKKKAKETEWLHSRRENLEKLRNEEAVNEYIALLEERVDYWQSEYNTLAAENNTLAAEKVVSGIGRSVPAEDYKEPKTIMKPNKKYDY